MALNSVLVTDVYDFGTTGNAFASKKLTALPLPAQFIDCTGASPDQRVSVYSKILFHEGGPGGFLKEAYSAETVAQLAAKANN